MQKSPVVRVPARGLGRQAKAPTGRKRPHPDAAIGSQNEFSPFMAGVLLIARVPKANHIASIDPKMQRTSCQLSWVQPKHELAEPLVYTRAICL